MAFKPGGIGERSIFPDGVTSVGMAVFHASEHNVYSAVLQGLKAGDFTVQDILDLERLASLLKALNFFELQQSSAHKAEIKRAIVDFEIKKLIEDK